MNILKQAALNIFETSLAKQGTVLAVRAWSPATFYEVDLHFPMMDMSGWDRVQHIKMKVAPGMYRDYTPAGWDAETRTCTIYINAAQESPGGTWVKGLGQGDVVTYIGVSNTAHRPVEKGKMVVLGDMSTLGHYLALQQLSGNANITGAIAIAEESHRAEFMDYFKWNVIPVTQTDQGGYHGIAKWVKGKNFDDTTIYVAGHIPTCGHLRKELKKTSADTIRVQGFWS